MSFKDLSARHHREISKRGNDALVASGKKHVFNSEEGRAARLKGIANAKERKERKALEYIRANGSLPL